MENDRKTNSEDRDIERLKKLLIQRKHPELARLLVGSRSNLNDTGRFGSLWNSTISKFEITSPLRHYESLSRLGDSQRGEILSCLFMLYPERVGEPEIVSVEFFPDLEDLDNSAVPSLVEPENLQSLEYDQIQEQIRKCREKIDIADFDGAITNARTLIESTCFFILEKFGIHDDYNGKLNQLYTKTAKALDMDASQYEDENLKKIISGAVTIVDGIGGIRNAYSDSHGASPAKRRKLSKRHTVLVVNLSKSICEFLYSSWSERSR